MPGAGAEIVARHAEGAASADLASILAVDGTAVVLDLEARLGLRLAVAVNRQSLAHVVVVLPRWPHADAILPIDELLGTLIEASREVRAVNASNVVFVLDGERQQSVARPAADSRVDNRYSLAAADLPNLATLRAAGIQRVVKVVRSR